MDQSGEQATLLARIQVAFEPYVKSKAEVARIRKLLADSPSESLECFSAQTPSLLRSVALNPRLPETALSEIERKYLKTLDNNRDVLRHYEKISSIDIERADQDGSGPNLPSALQTSPLVSFVELTAARQEHEKAQLIQEHLRALRDDLDATDAHLQEALTRVETLSEYLDPAVPYFEQTRQASASTGLTRILGAVERSTLSTKAQWRKEQLAVIQSQSACEDEIASQSWDADAISDAKFHALKAAHVALIAWIENELSNTNETVNGLDNTGISNNNEKQTPLSIQGVQTIYAEYVTARDRLLKRVATSTSFPAARRPSPMVKNLRDVHQVDTSRTADISLFAKRMRAISKDQKLISQQRSHLTNSANKEHKKTLDLLDRLRKESHLISGVRSRAATKENSRTALETRADGQNVGDPPTALLDKIAAWTSADQSAGQITNEVVLDHLESGEHAMEELRRSIGYISRLVGRDISVAGIDDVWTVLNGHVGMID